MQSNQLSWHRKQVNGFEWILDLGQIGWTLDDSQWDSWGPRVRQPQFWVLMRLHWKVFYESHDDNIINIWLITFLCHHILRIILPIIMIIIMITTATSPGQVWVINSNFCLQLNLCVCYRENQFGLIVGPGRALLTLPRSHICPVNKFVRKKSSLILVIVTGTFNRPVRWFINSMLSKWTRTLGGCKDCRSYSQ